MRLKKYGFITASFVILVFSLPRPAFGQGLPRGSPEASAMQLLDLLRSIEGVAKEPPRVFDTRDGYLRFVMAPPSTHFRAEGATPLEAAGAFLARWRNLFVNESAAIAFDAVRVKSPESRTYIRYQQTYGGLEVFGAQMMMQVNRSGGVVAVMSDIMRDSEVLDMRKVSLNPSLDPFAAQAKAIEWLTAQYQQIEFEVRTPTLIIFDPRVVGWKGRTRLAWQTEAVDVGAHLITMFLLVDAHTGEVVFHYSLRFPAMRRQVSDSNNTPGEEGDLVLDDDDPQLPYPCGVRDADRTYDYMKDTYEFYNGQHGRDSYDNLGDTVRATVRFCEPGEDCPWDGAHWDHEASGGARMRIGDGTVTDDTVGHEFTHGVTREECGFEYARTEAAAIAQSLSDMWGEWVDHTYNHNSDEYEHNDDDDSAAVKWYLFEDWASDPWPWRRMDQPPLCKTSSYYGPDFGDIPQPDRLYGPGWYYGSQDYGGVHHNLGVANKLCYLLDDGAYFNGYTISGMGISKTADLFYECQTNLLTSSADYYDLGNVLILAACNLGLTPAERDNVKNACAAVKILPHPYDCLPVCHPDYVEWASYGQAGLLVHGVSV